MEIRMIRPDEADKLVQARLDFFRIFYPDWTAGDAATEEAMAARLKRYYGEQLGRGLEVAAALDNGRIVSTASLVVIEKIPMPSAPNGRIGEVLNVMTYPEYGRRGLATRVMELLMEKAADMGLERIDLLASDEGETLYAKLGFTAFAGHRPMRRLLEANGGGLW